MGLANEFKTIELGDPRLNRRAVLLAERLGQKMEQTPLGRIRFMLSAGRGRKSRQVEQDMRVQRISLKDKSKRHIEMPTLNEVIRLIAQRGGFRGRKGDGEPGARTLWLGLPEITTTELRTAHPQART